MKPKFFITTTVARTLFFFQGQPQLWNKDFEVTAIAAEEDKLKAFAQYEGINYEYIPMHREISLFSDLCCLFRFIMLFVKERPAVVHGNTPKASMLSMLAAWITRRPIRIYMCHGLRYQTTSGLLRRVLMSMEWISCHCATIVIGVTQGVANTLVSDGLCDCNKIKVIGHGSAGGIDIDKFSRDALVDSSQNIREDLGISADDFIFCFVGRVVKDKGINELVEAFDKLSKEYDKIHLMLIGPEEGESDPINDGTKKLLDSHCRIYSLGRKNDVRPYIAACNALVLPSYREGLGQVILEANALEVPCIATDIIGPRDVIESLVNGELVKVRNVDSLYHKMKEWVENPSFVRDMGKTSRTFVESRFAQDIVRNNYYKEYCRLARLLD